MLCALHVSEGRNRKEIAINHAASTAEHRQSLVKAADERTAREAAAFSKLEAVVPILGMHALHGSLVEALKLQLSRHKVIGKRKLADGKAITLGGVRTDLLTRLCSVLSGIDAANAYDP